MKWMEQQSRYENTAYAVLWGLLFAAPVLSLWVRTASDASIAFDWREIVVVWRQLSIFLLLFLVHNFILAPLLVYRQKRWLYVLLTVCMVGAFTCYQCNHRPDGMRHHRRPHIEEAIDHRPPENHRSDYGERPHDMEDLPHDMENLPHDMEALPHDMEDFPHDMKDRPHDLRELPHRPPTFVGQHDIVAIVMLILICGMNLGIKLYFKNRKDQKKLAELEKENLEQQLEYLKYQINPHFFMNTLNNIHALVDIDPQKAQETILELSKMMRFVLYEGDKHDVPLTKEFEFIRTYINLMRLRYTDKVKISVDLPQEVPDKTVPPLMLISFIENAFKHGVSYQQDSFIEVKIEVRGQRSEVRGEKIEVRGMWLHFLCRNSKAEKPNEEKGGVGLQNVKKRLKLLYDDHYTLKIQDTDVYQVELEIPI